MELVKKDISFSDRRTKKQIEQLLQKMAEAADEAKTIRMFNSIGLPTNEGYIKLSRVQNKFNEAINGIMLITGQHLDPKKMGRVIDLQYLWDCTAEYFDTPTRILESDLKTREFSRMRQFFWLFCATHTKFPIKAAAYKVGKRDHTTALKGLKTLKGLIETEEETMSEYLKYENYILAKIEML